MTNEEYSMYDSLGCKKIKMLRRKKKKTLRSIHAAVRQTPAHTIQRLYAIQFVSFIQPKERGQHHTNCKLKITYTTCNTQRYIQKCFMKSTFMRLCIRLKAYTRESVT